MPNGTPVLRKAAVAAGPALGRSVLGEALSVALATAVAAWLRPWRMLGPPFDEAPARDFVAPWPWLFVALLLPLLWTADRWSGQAVTPLASGAVLLLLLAGWPLAMLAMACAGLLAAADGTLPPEVALARCFWLGTLPATVALGLGALVRRWFAGWLFGYLLGRTFAATLAALWIAQALAGAHGAQTGTAGAGLPLPAPAWMLTGFAEACLTGFGVAAAVALRPAWVATWAGPLYGVAEPTAPEGGATAEPRRRS